MWLDFKARLCSQINLYVLKIHVTLAGLFIVKINTLQLTNRIIILTVP